MAAASNRFTDPTGEFVPCLVYNDLRCMGACVGKEAVMYYIMGCGGLDLKGSAIDFAKSCLWSMPPIPDPCGKFGHILSTAVGLVGGLMGSSNEPNRFTGDTRKCRA